MTLYGNPSGSGRPRTITLSGDAGIATTRSGKRRAGKPFASIRQLRAKGRAPAAFLFTLLACITTPTLAADDATRLQALRDASASIEQKLRKAEVQRDATSQSISVLDKKINESQVARRKARAETATVKSEITTLEQTLKLAQSEVEVHQSQIAKLTRSALATGREPYLKILLNQSDPVRLGRSMAWYRYVARARAQAIELVGEKINRVSITQSRLLDTQSKLQQLERTLKDSESSLASKLDEKKQLLASIDNDIAARTARAQTLRQDQLALQTLLQEIEKSRIVLREKTRLEAEQNRLAEEVKEQEQEALKKANVVPPLEGYDFAGLKGRLPFPAKGKIGARFGEPKPGSNGEFKWEGVLLFADAGTTVRAVADGEVIWVGNVIRGAGEVIVIDHGDDYSSVYMHNSELLRQLGDRVRAGEEIAYIGSAGLDRPGLLFRINHDNNALDPLKWLLRND